MVSHTEGKTVVALEFSCDNNQTHFAVIKP